MDAVRLVHLDGLGKVQNARLDVVDVTVVEAVGVCAFAWVALYRHRDPLIGSEMPYDVDGIAIIVRAQPDAELAANLPATQMRDLLGWSEIGKLHRGALLGGEFESGAHFLSRNLQALARRSLDFSVGDVEIAGANLGFASGNRKCSDDERQNNARALDPFLKSFHFEPVAECR